MRIGPCNILYYYMQCTHNFNISIYISSLDLNFDTKPSPSGQNENIFSQPRASSTSPQQQYSFSNSTSGSNINAEQQSPIENIAVPPYSNVRTQHRNSNASNTSPTSPVINGKSSSSSSSSSASTPTTGSKSNSRRSSQTKEGRQISKTSTSSYRNEELPSVHEKLPKSGIDKIKPRIIDHIDLTNSECECSDDETISKFTKEYMKTSPLKEIDSRQNVEPEAGPSGNSNNLSSTDTKGDTSTTSSFEELGASASGVSNGDWLFITKPSEELPTSNVMNTECTQPQNEDSNASSNINLTNLTFQNVQAHSSHSSQSIYPGTSSDQQRVRRLVRRRSDGAIYNSSGTKLFSDDMEEMSEDETLRKRSKTSSCDKCGKSKRSLKRHVARFKRQLETTNASEMEIKKQLEAFLQYLETCNKNSVDGTDTESIEERIDTANNVDIQDQALGDNEITDFDQLNDDDDEDDNYDFEYDEGIHVYGTDETKGTPRQFVNINDYANRYVGVSSFLLIT